MPVGAGIAVGTVGAGILSSRAAKSAAETGAEGAALSGAQIQQAADRARTDVLDFFPAAQQDLLAGAGAAGGLLAGGIGEQQRLLSAGNVGAQGTLQGGFGQVQNALLGLPVNQQAFAPKSIELSQIPQNPLAQTIQQNPAALQQGTQNFSPETIKQIGLNMASRAQGQQPQGLFSQVGQVKEAAQKSRLGNVTTNIDVLSKVASGDVSIPGVDPDWVGKFMANLTPGKGFATSSSLNEFAIADSTKGLEAWLKRSGLNNENKEQMRRLVRGLQDIRGNS